MTKRNNTKQYNTEKFKDNENMYNLIYMYSMIQNSICVCTQMWAGRLGNKPVK